MRKNLMVSISQLDEYWIDATDNQMFFMSPSGRSRRLAIDQKLSDRSGS